MVSKKSRRAAILAMASPTPPAPTRRILMATRLVATAHGREPGTAPARDRSRIARPCTPVKHLRARAGGRHPEIPVAIRSEHEPDLDPRPADPSRDRGARPPQRGAAAAVRPWGPGGTRRARGTRGGRRVLRRRDLRRRPAALAVPALRDLLRLARPARRGVEVASGGYRRAHDPRARLRGRLQGT